MIKNNTGQHDFWCQEIKHVFQEFDGTDSENDLSFSWLATIFVLLLLLIFWKKKEDQFTILADRKI